MSAPDLNVYTSYTDKVPGKWLLYVEGSALHHEVKPDGLTCAAYSWPIDLGSAFKQTAAGTFRNLVENVELVDQPVPASALAQRGYRGVIRINGDDLRVHLSMETGFFESTAEVSTEIDAGILVDGASGRMLGTQATGLGRASSGSGGFCEGNSHAIEEASENAMKAVMGQLAERFSNAPQIRGAH